MGTLLIKKWNLSIRLETESTETSTERIGRRSESFHAATSSKTETHDTASANGSGFTLCKHTQINGVVVRDGTRWNGAGLIATWSRPVVRCLSNINGYVEGKCQREDREAARRVLKQLQIAKEQKESCSQVCLPCTLYSIRKQGLKTVVISVVYIEIQYKELLWR